MHAEERVMREARGVVERARSVRERLLERTPALRQASLEYPLASLLQAFDAADPYLGHRHRPQGVVAACERLNTTLGTAGLSDFLQLLLAHLAEDFERRFEDSRLAEEFRPEFESNLMRMMDRAAAPQDWRASLSDDVYLKDLGIARQVLIP